MRTLCAHAASRESKQALCLSSAAFTPFISSAWRSGSRPDGEGVRNTIALCADQRSRIKGSFVILSPYSCMVSLYSCSLYSDRDHPYEKSEKAPNYFFLQHTSLTHHDNTSHSTRRSGDETESPSLVHCLSPLRRLLHMYCNGRTHGRRLRPARRFTPVPRLMQPLLYSRRGGRAPARSARRRPRPVKVDAEGPAVDAAAGNFTRDEDGPTWPT